MAHDLITEVTERLTDVACDKSSFQYGDAADKVKKLRDYLDGYLTALEENLREDERCKNIYEEEQANIFLGHEVD